MTLPQFDVLMLGDYFFDMVFIGLERLPRLGCELFSKDLMATGGAAFITATALHRLGVKVGWVGSFGSDYYSQYVRDLAIREGLDLSLARDLETPYRRVTTSMAYDGERAFVTYMDPDAPNTLDYWLHTMDSCTFRHVHLGGLERAEVILALAEKAHRRGATFSTDCQDSPLLQHPYPWREVLAQTDLFVPNAREAMLITDTDTVDAALPLLAAMCPLVLVKDGPRGAWIVQQEQITLVTGIHAGDAVDTTGAGDCFNAGLLYGYIVSGVPLETSVRYGNICGGLSVTGIGGATNAPTQSELMAWMMRL